MAEINQYKVACSPHKLDGATTRRVMLDVLIALLPCLVCGVVFFGLYALMLVVICVAACFASEQVYNLIRKKPFTTDLSALVTGVILGLNLPPRAPWYIPVVGGVFAIVIVKMLFGGLGKNFANPAAAGRVFLLLAYGSAMTSFIGADIAGNILSADVTTGATYLGGGVGALADGFLGAEGYWGYVLQLFLGKVGGSIGETSALAVLIGGGYLIARRVIDWRIPLVYLLTAAAMALLCYGSANEILLQLFSGGLMFGAFFMATDYATSPKWKYNRVLYAFGLGVITVLIRRFGSYPEGTSLAILFMNLLVPAMDRFLVPVRFGQTTKKGAPKPQVMKWAMRGLCLVLALAIAVAAPLVSYTEVAFYKGDYAYIQSVSRDFSGKYVFDVKGTAELGKFSQPLEYEIQADAKSQKVVGIRPITQSTKGYVAELSFFEGKTYDEIVALKDLSTDAQTSATYTNIALKNMIVECFSALDFELGKYTDLVLQEEYTYISGAERSGAKLRFTVSGQADLSSPSRPYFQQLEYVVAIENGRVKYIQTVTESTKGYTVDRALFLGKTYEDILAMTEEGIRADGTTGATITNVKVRDMLLECFESECFASAAGGEQV